MVNGPSARSAHAMSYDVARDVTVLFGGDGAPADTWEWDGTTWIRRRPGSGPRGRFSHAMVRETLLRQADVAGRLAGHHAACTRVVDDPEQRAAHWLGSGDPRYLESARRLAAL